MYTIEELNELIVLIAESLVASGRVRKKNKRINSSHYKALMQAINELSFYLEKVYLDLEDETAKYYFFQTAVDVYMKLSHLVRYYQRMQDIKAMEVDNELRRTISKNKREFDIDESEEDDAEA